jgi:NADH-quinone oxidoreductase subunit L
MAIPLVLLAIPSLLIGFAGFPPDEGRIHKFLSPVFAEGGHTTEAATQPAETASLYVLQESSTDEHDETTTDEAAAGGHAEHHISNTTKWTFGIISTVIALAGIFVAYLTYITGTISATAVGRRFSGVYDFLYNKWYIDEFYDRTIVQPFKNLAMVFWRVIDVGIIDATVNGTAGLVNGISGRLRTLQTGLVGNYALAIALGMVVIIGVYFAAFSDLLR